MSIINRIKSIFSANVNAALDEMEDPQKMSDQYIREAEEALGEVKAKVADAMVISDKCEKKVAGCKSTINELNKYAEAACLAGNEEDVEKFISKRVTLEEQLAEYETARVAASANVVQIRGMYEEMAKTLQEYKDKRDIICSKSAVLKISKQSNNIKQLALKENTAFSGFKRMEEKLDNELFKQKALLELNKDIEHMDDVKAKYNVTCRNEKVAAAIAQMKEDMSGVLPAKA